MGENTNEKIESLDDEITKIKSRMERALGQQENLANQYSTIDQNLSFLENQVQTMKARLDCVDQVPLQLEQTNQLTARFDQIRRQFDDFEKLIMKSRVVEKLTSADNSSEEEVDQGVFSESGDGQNHSNTDDDEMSKIFNLDSEYGEKMDNSKVNDQNDAINSSSNEEVGLFESGVNGETIPKVSNSSTNNLDSNGEDMEPKDMENENLDQTDSINTVNSQIGELRTSSTIRKDQGQLGPKVSLRHSGRTKQHHCPFCPQSFTLSTIFKIHLESKHKQLLKRNERLEFHYKLIQPSIKLDDQSTYQHIRCSECDRSFIYTRALDYHRNLTHKQD